MSEASRFYKLIRYPLITEKAVTGVELRNKVTLIVDGKARKGDIKNIVERYFDVEVVKVNTLNTVKADKKAIVTFKNRDDAVKVAIALGVI